MIAEDKDRAREDLLQQEIGKLARKKWRVISQSRFNAQLERQRITLFQAVIILCLLFCFLIPGLIYAAIVGKGKTEHLYLEVTPKMKVVRRKN
jgi:hypothetical protein